MAIIDVNPRWKEQLGDPLSTIGTLSTFGELHTTLTVSTLSKGVVLPSQSGLRSNSGQDHTKEASWMTGLQKPPRSLAELKVSEADEGSACLEEASYKDKKVAEVYQEPHDILSLLNSIKACSKQKDLRKGRRIHAGILETGLLKRNIYIATSLIRMYAKCGALGEAQEVFDALPGRDVVSWNTLIAGYAQHNCGKEALKWFHKMQEEGLSPDLVTFLSIIKACGSIGALEKGEQIHAEVRRQGLLQKHSVLGSALVDMYVKCGVLVKAQEAFYEFPARDVAMWTALIAGFAHLGRGNEALKAYGQMKDEGISPDALTFVCVLKACGIMGAIEKGEEIHAEVSRQGLLQVNVVLGNAVVDMYARCGSLERAQEVLDQLPSRDVASWTALIAGYVHHGRGEEALASFERMQAEHIFPNVVTYVCMLKACSSMALIEKGRGVHVNVIRDGLLGRNVVLGNALVDMYAKCGALVKAEEVLDDLSVRDVVSWNALIGGYAQLGLGNEALNCFQRMQEDSLFADEVTFVCILKACGSVGALAKGEEIHLEVKRERLLEKSISVGNALVDMYGKCGALAKAQGVFDELPARDSATWHALMAGYAQHGHIDKALHCLEGMRDEGFSPDAVVYVCILKACGSIRAIEKGEEIHEGLRKEGLLGKCLLLGTALVDMYAKFGAIVKSREVFDELPVRDVAVWTALISGYAQNGLADEALACFMCLREEGFSPNAVTFVCALKACGCIGAKEMGEEIHCEVMGQGLLESNIAVGNALVDMYAKCGALAKAQEVLDELVVRDVVTWTALIGGYAQLGKVKRAFKLLNKMIGEEVEPSAVTLSVLLNACSHTGLVQQGQACFLTMTDEYNIIPVWEHLACMIDLFGRAGQFDKSICVIDKGSPDAYLQLWMALLGACRTWANVEFGTWAFEHALKLGLTYAGAYVCMSNIYAAAGLEEAD